MFISIVLVEKKIMFWFRGFLLAGNEKSVSISGFFGLDFLFKHFVPNIPDIVLFEIAFLLVCSKKIIKLCQMQTSINWKKI